MIRDNPRIQSAARSLGQAGMSMSEATSRALQDTGVLSAINRVNGTLGFLGDSIAETAVYKSVAAGLEEAVGDVPVADGYEAREARLARREARARKAGKSRRVKANPE
jgi:import inner membrane translocase subunit TIM44